jgi:hypothetical protein
MIHIDGMDRDYKIAGCEYKRVVELYDLKQEKTFQILKYEIIKIKGDQEECEKLMKDDPKCGDAIVFKDGIIVDVDLFSNYIIEFQRCILNLLQNPFKYENRLTDLKIKIEEATKMIDLLCEKPLLEKKYEYYKEYKKQLLKNQKIIQDKKQENVFKVDKLLCTLSIRTFIESHEFIHIEY